MRKLMIIAAASMLTLGSLSISAEASGRGGFMGFISGCCFGPRAAADYNSGKDIHWREWVRIVPVVSIVFAVWDGIEGYNGKTRADWVSEYGSAFY